MPLRLYVRWHARLDAARARLALRARLLGRQAGFSTAEGLAGAALSVVALIAIWAAMKAFGLDIIRWMQDQITSAGGGAGGR
jgi:hypothetical protein